MTAGAPEVLRCTICRAGLYRIVPGSTPEPAIAGADGVRYCATCDGRECHVCGVRSTPAGPNAHDPNCKTTRKD